MISKRVSLAPLTPFLLPNFLHLTRIVSFTGVARGVYAATRIGERSMKRNHRSNSSPRKTGAIIAAVLLLLAGLPSLATIMAAGTSCTSPGPVTIRQAEAGPMANQVTIAWDAVVNGGCAVTYEIHWRGCGINPNWTLFTKTSATSFQGGNWPPRSLCEFTVTPFNGQYGSGDWVAILTYDRPGAPSASASPGPNGGMITVSWSPSGTFQSTPITQYWVERANSATGPWAQWATTDGTDTDFQDAGLAPSSTFYYRVRGYNGYFSDYSNVASATTFSPPPAPSGLTATTGPNGGQIQLAWSPTVSSPAVTSYTIYRASSPSGSFSNIGTTSDTSYIDSGLPASTTFWYRVSATNTAGEGGQSFAASATTFPAPDAPASATATAGPDRGKISLAWTAATSHPAVPVQGYRIYRGVSLAATTGPNDLAYEDSGLPDGTEFTYTIAAFSGAGEGAHSQPVSAVTFALPSAPASVYATGFPGRIAVAWDAATTDSPARPVLRYTVYRSSSTEGERDIADVQGGQQHYVDEDVEPGETYHYRISALNVVGEGPKSPTASARVPVEETYSVSEGAQGIGYATPEVSTPETEEIKIDSPPVTVPSLCSMTEACEEDEDPLVESQSVDTPPVSVPKKDVGPLTVGPYTLPSQHVADTPEIGKPPVCDTLSQICFPPITIPPQELVTVFGQQPIVLVPEIKIRTILWYFYGNVTPNAGEVGPIRPIRVDVPTPWGYIPIGYCDTPDPIFCYGPVLPESDFSMLLEVRITIGTTEERYAFPLSGST